MDISIEALLEVKKSILSSTMHYFSLVTFLHCVVVVVQLVVLLTIAFKDLFVIFLLNNKPKDH